MVATRSLPALPSLLKHRNTYFGYGADSFVGLRRECKRRSTYVDPALLSATVQVCHLFWSRVETPTSIPHTRFSLLAVPDLSRVLWSRCDCVSIQ